MMTDRNEILRQIADGIGSESTDELAEAMFYELQSRGGIEFDADCGFQFVRDDEPPEWGGGEVIGWKEALKSVLSD